MQIVVILVAMFTIRKTVKKNKKRKKSCGSSVAIERVDFLVPDLLLSYVRSSDPLGVFEKLTGGMCACVHLQNGAFSLLAVSGKRQ